jgi:hypothetical protein
LVTRRDKTGAIGHDRNNSDRRISQRWVEVLLNGGKVGVEINEQIPEHRRAFGWSTPQMEREPNPAYLHVQITAR